MPEGFTLRDRLRLCSAGSPTVTDRIEFTLPAIPGGRCYGLAVLVPLLSTPGCHDAVTVQYLTILHRMEANFHRFNRTPSQAHRAAPLAVPPTGGDRDGPQSSPQSGHLSYCADWHLVYCALCRATKTNCMSGFVAQLGGSVSGPQR
jgi:hypothetical protein